MSIATAMLLFSDCKIAEERFNCNVDKQKSYIVISYSAIITERE